MSKQIEFMGATALAKRLGTGRNNLYQAYKKGHRIQGHYVHRREVTEEDRANGIHGLAQFVYGLSKYPEDYEAPAAGAAVEIEPNRSLQLEPEALEALDALRGDTGRSDYLNGLLEGVHAADVDLTPSCHFSQDAVASFVMTKLDGDLVTELEAEIDDLREQLNNERTVSAVLSKGEDTADAKARALQFANDALQTRVTKLEAELDREVKWSNECQLQWVDAVRALRIAASKHEDVAMMLAFMDGRDEVSDVG